MTPVGGQGISLSLAEETIKCKYISGARQIGKQMNFFFKKIDIKFTKWTFLLLFGAQSYWN